MLQDGGKLLDNIFTHSQENMKPLQGSDSIFLCTKVSYSSQTQTSQQESTHLRTSHE